jgi:hypothetical protein
MTQFMYVSFALPLAAALLAAGDAPARTDALRTLVLIAAERDRELAARVAGQVTDLDVTLTTSPASLPPDLAGQLAAARAAAAAAGADAVVWFGSEGGDWIVYVTRGERVLVRRVRGASGAMSASASIESAALVVRTALRGLATGGEIGVEEPPPQRTALRPWVELGWSGLLDAEGSGAHHGAVASAGASRGPWRLAATFTYHPSPTLGSGQATLQVDRQTVALLLGVDFVGGSSPDAPWRIGAEVSAGAARFPRVTTGSAAGLTPTATRTLWSPIVSPALRLTRRLALATSLALTLGADVIAQPPEFGVAGPSGFERVAALRTVAPRAGLSLVIEP